MIKATIFDLDNTLYDENTYFLHVFKFFCNKYGIDIKQIKNIIDDNFRLQSKDIFADILKKISFYSKDMQNELFEIYKNLDCSLKLYDDAREIINFLKKKNIKIAIVTNGVIHAQKNKIRSLNISQKIDSIVYARKFGREYEKPNKKAFLEALSSVKCNTNEAIFVGDNPQTDIKGANNINMVSVWLKRGYAKNLQDEKADYCIDNLLELKDIIGNIK